MSLLSLLWLLTIEVRAGLTVSSGSTPTSIFYQGTLADNGFAVTGTRLMSFRFYDSTSGGTLLGSAGPVDVGFERGLFGAALAVSTSIFSRGSPVYLEVQVDAVVLSPRDPLGVKPFALVAKTIEGSLEVSQGGLAVASALSVSSQTGNVGVGTTSPQSALDARGVIGGGGTAGLTVTASGAVGIGLASPSSKAAVAGDLRLLGAGALIFPDSTQQTSALVVGTPAAITAAASVGVVGDSQGAGAGDAVLRTGAAPVDRLRAFNGGSIGIGSAAPAARLHVSSGILIVDGTGAGLQSGTVDLMVSGGLAGIGTSQPRTLLDVNGEAQFGAGTFKSTVTAQGNLQLVSGSTLTSKGTLSLSTALFIDGSARVGLGTLAPRGALEVNGSGRFGLAAKSAFDASGNLQFSGGATISSNGTLCLSTAATAAATGLPAIFIDGAGRVGAGTGAPGAFFEVASSTGAVIKGSAAGAGSVGLAVVKGQIGQTGTQVCGTGSCLAYWESTGTNLGCAGASTTLARALCGAIRE